MTNTLKQLTTVSHIILLIGLAYIAATLTWKMLPSNHALTPAPVALSTKTTVPDKINAPSQGVIINKYALFGKINRAPIAPPTPPPPPKAAPITPLNLILKGVFASKGHPRAIISGSNNEDNVYTIGNRLPGNAELLEIYADKVVLLRSGTRETLYLPKEQAGLGSNNAVNAPYTPSPTANYAAPNTSLASHPKNRRQSRAMNRRGIPPQPYTNQTFGDTTVDASELMEAFMNDPISLMDYARISPARQGGKQIGFRIYRGQMQGQLERFGLQAGDIITSVNDIPLNEHQSLGQIMNIVSQNSRVHVELLRNGTTLSKNVQLR